MKLMGYVAKDLSLGARVFLYTTIPVRNNGVWLPKSGDKTEAITLSNGAFQNLRWSDNPVEVEIIIKPKRKKLKRWLGVAGR
jgi:hypothetical protein